MSPLLPGTEVLLESLVGLVFRLLAVSLMASLSSVSYPCAFLLGMSLEPDRIVPHARKK